MTEECKIKIISPTAELWDKRYCQQARCENCRFSVNMEEFIKGEILELFCLVDDKRHKKDNHCIYYERFN